MLKDNCLIRLFAFFCVVAMGSMVAVRPMLASEPAAPAVTADEAIGLLKQGNERFASGHPRHPHEDAAWRHDTAAHGQHPFATVLTCSDSRLPVELLFDEGIGDVFVIRVAGNVCDTDEAGSIEYAVEHLGTPLVLVLGHSQCGAVTAAVTHAEAHGAVKQLVGHIAPAVERAEHAHPELHGEALVPAAVEANVWLAIESLFHTSEAVREAVTAGKLKVEGAVYDIDSGHLRWLGQHADQKKLLQAEGQ